MAFFCLFILVVVLTVRFVVWRERWKKMELRLAVLERELATLRTGPVPVVSDAAEAVDHPVRVPPPPPPPPRPAASEDKVVFFPPVAPPPMAAEPVARQRSLAERVRSLFGNEEWEALVGGSVLNKVGAFVLVIGIALFLGYSLTHLTPAGRSFTALAVSLGLLGGGVVLERSRKNYGAFARGLIGAGWAALYVTAFAAYALPAAQLITNPVLGSALLILVAAAMIAHSLRYRSETLTAIAFISAFAALAVTPSSLLAVLGLLPLAASVLFLAHRFQWNVLALFGVIGTYGTCVSRAHSNAPLFATQSILLVCWLLFELFDWQRVRRQVDHFAADLVFPLNAIGFLVLSEAAWSIHDRERIWILCAFSAALYAVSAAVRFAVRPPASFPLPYDLTSRVRAGSYEAPAAISAVLAGFAIAGRAVGIWQGTGFAVEAEVLYLLGVFLDLRFLRWMGNLGFGVSLLSLVLDSFGMSRNTPGVHRWATATIFQAVLFGVNRALRYGLAIYSYLAAGLVGLVLAAELPEKFVGAGWLLLALVLLELGLRLRLREFRFQAYAFAAAGAALTTYYHLFENWAHPAIPLGCGLALVYAVVLRLRLVPASMAELRERRWLNAAGAVAIAALSFLLVWRVTPDGYRGLALCWSALLLLELGMRCVPAELVGCSYAALPVAVCALVAEAWPQFGKEAPSPIWISYAGAAGAAYAFATRTAFASHEQISARQRHWVAGIASCLGTLFALVALWIVVAKNEVAPLWALVSLMLLAIGTRRTVAPLRWQAYAAIVAAVWRAWDTNLQASSKGHLTGAVWSVALVVVLCYVGQWLSPVNSEAMPSWPRFEKHARTFWSVLGTLLLSVLLSHQFPGGLLTIAWGGEGLALLGAGFPLRERVLRLEGLAVFGICIAKLFLYDLQNLETIYRILSFIALGLVLLLVSWAYTRFRERINRYL
jgi:hypothetical protein